MKIPDNLTKTWLKPDTISIAVGIASAFSGILGIVTKFFESSFGIAVIVVGIFFIVQRLLNYVIRRRKESFGVQTHYYSNRQVRIATIAKKLSYALWLVPLVVVTNAVFAVRKCMDNNQLGIVISSFSAKEEDDFSYKLFHVLNADLENADSVGLIRDERFIDVGKENYMSELQTGLSEHCFKKGLFVFGKRNATSQMFDCNIYVDKLPSILQKHLPSAKSGILYLQNPAVMNFSIDNEAQAVSKFILGLLYYNAQDYERVAIEIGDALQKQDTMQNRFKSYCRLFLGNSLLMNGKPTEAVKVFHEGIIEDKTDAFLHYNLAATYLFMDDSVNAKMQYEEAARLNKRFANPLKDVEVTVAEDTSSEKEVIEEPQPEITVAEHRKSAEKHVPGTKEQVTGPEYTIIVQRGKYGIVNQSGDTIVPMKYDRIDDEAFILDGHHYFMVELNQKYGALKENGEEEVPIVHGSEDYVKKILQIQSTILKQENKVDF